MHLLVVCVYHHATILAPLGVTSFFWFFSDFFFLLLPFFYFTPAYTAGAAGLNIAPVGTAFRSAADCKFTAEVGLFGLLVC